jgi:hypothetical protein
MVPSGDTKALGNRGLDVFVHIACFLFVQQELRVLQPLLVGRALADS